MSKQPIKKQVSSPKGKKSTPKPKKKTMTKRPHPQYGTSKLEEDFARNFLDKLGVKYSYQFEAKDIGRFYDFFVEPTGPIIEINGGYWHGDPRLYEEKDLNHTQKHAQRVDEYKKKWALTHGYPIYYFWEKDIRETPSKVLKELKEILYIEEQKKKKPINEKRKTK